MVGNGGAFSRGRVGIFCGLEGFWLQGPPPGLRCGAVFVCFFLFTAYCVLLYGGGGFLGGGGGCTVLTVPRIKVREKIGGGRENKQNSICRCDFFFLHHQLFCFFRSPSKANERSHAEKKCALYGDGGVFGVECTGDGTKANKNDRMARDNMLVLPLY